MDQIRAVFLVLGLLVNGFEEKRILGQSLYRLHEYVRKFQSLAFFLSFAPLQHNELQQPNKIYSSNETRFGWN